MPLAIPFAALGSALTAGAATGAAATGIGALATGAAVAPTIGGIVGAKMQSSAARDAANAQVAAANHAADLQAKANADSLAFQEQQAAQQQANFNATQQANYNQWASREGRLSTLGQMVGLPARDIPAYVPTLPVGTSPTATGSATPAGATSSASGTNAFPTVPTGGNPLDDNAIMQALQANYKALGVNPTGPGSGPTDIAYMAQKIKEGGGLTAQNFPYWFGPQGRIAQAVQGTYNPGGGSSASGSSQTAGYQYTPVTTMGNALMAPALTAPTVTPRPYQPIAF